MAFAHVATHNATTSKSSSNAIAPALASNVAAGSLLVFHVAYDNVDGAMRPAVTSISRPGGETAIWYRLAAHNSSATANSGGCRSELWGIKVTQQWTSAQTVTATLSASVSVRVARMAHFSGMTGTIPECFRTSAAGTSTAGSPTATTASLTAGDLVIGAAGFEMATAPTGDSDTTNGAWSAAATANTTGGAADSNIATCLQYKIVTGVGAQTFNPTGSLDSGVAMVVFAPDPLPAPHIRESYSSGIYTAESYTFNTSSAVQVDDVLCVVQTKDYYAASGMVAPTGTAGTWSERALGTLGTDNRHIKIWTRAVTAAGVQQVITHKTDTDDQGISFLYVIKNTAGFDVAAAVNAVASTSHAAPSLTTTGTNDLIIAAWATGLNGSDDRYYTPAPMLRMHTATDGGFDQFESAVEQVPAAGATGTRTALYTSSYAYVAAMVAFKPAAPSPSFSGWGVPL